MTLVPRNEYEKVVLYRDCEVRVAACFLFE